VGGFVGQVGGVEFESGGIEVVLLVAQGDAGFDDVLPAAFGFQFGAEFEGVAGRVGGQGGVNAEAQDRLGCRGACAGWWSGPFAGRSARGAGRDDAGWLRVRWEDCKCPEADS